MKTVDMEAADYNLAALVDQAIAGEEVMLVKQGKPLVRLMPVEPEEKKKDRASTLGMLKGKIWMSDDFDAPLPDDILRGFGMID